MLGISRLRTDDYLSLLICATCSQSLTQTFEFFSDFCDSCISPNIPNLKKFCSSCKPENCKNCNKLNPLPNTFSPILKSFFIVSCPKHLKICSHYLEPYFIPICKDCKEINKISKLKQLDYKSLENLFKDLINKYFHLLSREQKTFLVTESLSGMLKALNWLTRLEIGPSCIKHQERPAKFIDLNDNLLSCYCEKCKQVSKKDLKTSDSEILSKVFETAKTAENRFLDKFLLKLFKDWPNPQKKGNFNNFLLLEYENLTQKARPGPLRCVACLKKILVGGRRGYIMKCSHLVCFTCSLNIDLYCCIDKSQISVVNVQPLDLPELWCHFYHKIKGKSEVFKQPCGHLTCIDHRKLDYCMKCGFFHSFWNIQGKSSETFTELLKFVYLECRLHKKQAKFYSFHLESFGCEDCKLQVSINNGKYDGVIEINVNFIHRVLNRVLEFLHPKYDQQAELSTVVLKSYKYFSVISMQKQLSLLQILKVLGKYPSQFRTFCEVEKFFIHKPKLPKYHFEKFRIFEGKVRVILALRPGEDVILTGFFTLSPALIFDSPGPVHNIPKRIKLVVFNKEQKEIDNIEVNFYFESWKTESNDEMIAFKFSTEIYAKESNLLEFCFEFEEELYWIMTGIFYRQKSFIQLEKPFKSYDESEVTVLDARFGGYVYGLEFGVVRKILQRTD